VPFRSKGGNLNFKFFFFSFLWCFRFVVGRECQVQYEILSSFSELFSVPNFFQHYISESKVNFYFDDDLFVLDFYPPHFFFLFFKTTTFPSVLAVTG